MPATAPTARRAPRPRLFAPPGVYRPQADTRLLAAALDREELAPGTAVMEIGTGTGALALRAAGRGARVTGVDISWAAVAAAYVNALRRRLRVRVLHGDFAARTRGQRFDLVLANPPYVPSPEPRTPTRGPARAWDAGPTGRLVIDRICELASALLRPGGVLLLVHSGLCGPQTTVRRLERSGLSARIVQRAAVPWGPVLRSRRAWLESQGLAEAGGVWEELVIIRARCP